MTPRACAFAASLALAGCGGPPATTVTGTVTYGGEPLRAGSIVFEPKPGSAPAGPTGSAPVVDGRYRIPADFALTGGGTYRVRVHPPLIGSGDRPGAKVQFPAYETTAELPALKPAVVDLDVPRNK